MRSSVGFAKPTSTLSANYNTTVHSSPPTHTTNTWHSPVPYLFGGLAAMLGLIAFALLILACSYWKLSGYLDGGDELNEDMENGHGRDKETDKTKNVVPCIYEERIVVIMAGDRKPTYLATPVSSRASSFNDGGSCNVDGDEGNCSNCVDGMKRESENLVSGNDQDEHRQEE